ncbi:hypothetical protein NDU88_006711 [Pleurodeles waltl]|uniref:Uncharacterized protein n=1 Tax=Pleurodeles waltl TaxID=8319 RepID=A0AAV7WZ12_PLEWA|nr:hypothetical protein NDU88_006711 [Pleurodeles waltl]
MAFLCLSCSRRRYTLLPPHSLHSRVASHNGQSDSRAALYRISSACSAAKQIAAELRLLSRVACAGRAARSALWCTILHQRAKRVVSPRLGSGSSKFQHPGGPGQGVRQDYFWAGSGAIQRASTPVVILPRLLL